jgi:site-specific recombinase XerD
MGGPLAIYADGFRQELTARGYVHQVVERNLRVLVHLSDWMQAGSVSVGQLSPARLETFIGDRRQQGYRGWLSVPAVTPLLGYLRSVGVVLATPEAPAARGPVEQLVEQYQRYLVDERGLSAAVMRKYSEFAHAFLSATEGPDGLELADLSAATVTDYVVSEYAARPSRSAKSTVTALRSLLRYLFLAGLVEHQLALAVPTAANWQAGSLPRALGPEAVAALTASCDDSTEIGSRDRAILVLLCRLGLRACEITRLELDDLDWRSGEVSVSGKGGRRDRLPLPVDVGEVLVAYLQQARPHVRCRKVFLRVNAPIVGLTTPAVTGVVYKACARAGLPRVGAHRLRHSAATAMLARGGNLVEVGQVLRHVRAETTAIYAKVDRIALDELVRPWPGVLA